MTAILGISAFYHDSAAALVIDGQIVAAAQEERFTRVKHDANFPAHAIEFCLRAGNLRPEQIDHVVFYEKPLLKFERLLETYLAVAPAGFRSFLKAMPLWVHEKLQLPRVMNRGLGGRYRRPYIFTEHHEAHAASAFFPSPFDEAAIMTIDGVGEWATSTLGIGTGNRIELAHEMRFPHSLGLLYSAFTYFCGFKVNSGEYKLMGLAPYGEPTSADVILERLMDLKEDGSFRLDMSYFNYCAGLTMTSRKFEKLFGGPPRAPESPITRRELDLAASIQKVTELVMLRMVRHLRSLTGRKNLCLAGGVALNCVGNGRILREGPFERIWIQPAAGDGRGAVCVAPAPRKAANPRETRRATWIVARPGVFERRGRVGAHESRRSVSLLRERRCAFRARRRIDCRRQGRRLDAGRDGVRPARARRAQHPRRCAQSRDADDNELEDKIPGIVSPVRANRAARARAGILRTASGRREPVHAARRAGPGRKTNRGNRGDRERHRARARGPLRRAGDHARRLQRAPPDRRRRAKSTARETPARL